MPEGSHPLVRLAAEAITAYLDEYRIIAPPDTVYSEAPEAQRQAGVFVCLKREGLLRGCIGTTDPMYRTIAHEVIFNAIGAATRDYRFPPVQRFEVTDLVIWVDILGLAERTSDVADLDPKRFGVIVQSGDRRGVLLPDLEGISSAEEQVTIARQKAGLCPDDLVEIFRFEVTRYK
jgi:AmmeMemoRadiSam system protein A